MFRRVANASRYLVVGGGATAGAIAAYRYRKIIQCESELSKNEIVPFNGPSKNQRVIVIGGGVVGVTTAYKLAQKGHSVVILEPRSIPGAECSNCAAGGMARSNPVVDRDSWVAVTKCILPKPLTKLIFGSVGSFDFFHISWRDTLLDPFFLRWVLTFTKTSLFPSKDQDSKQLEMLKFTKFAVDDMVEMMENRRDNMSTRSGYNSRGSLSLSYDPISEAPKGNPTSSKMCFEPSRRLVGEEVLKEEPSLRFQEVQPTSAKYEYEAKSASSGRFTVELADRCIKDPKLDVSILYDTAVKAISVTDASSSDGKQRISELKTNRGVIKVGEDVRVVVAAGTWTSHVLALMDLYAPVYPLKGYSMSVSAKEVINATALKDTDLPSRIVADKYMFSTRLGDQIRITSVGEFSGWNTKPTPQVDVGFRKEAVRQFPQLSEFIDKATTYCGHRPFVSDGILLLGAVDTHENLFVTCGPGSNGWKLAMGSGEVMERLVSGQSEEHISKDLGFNVSALSPAGRVLKAPFFSRLCRAKWNV